MMRLVATTSAVAVLFLSGLVHGLWTDRWAAAEDLDGDLAELRSLPLTIGDWQGEDLQPKKQGGSEGLVSLARRYVNRGTGEVVSILLACGRPGPISIHTPDVCYAASGYEVEKPARFTVKAAGQAPAAVFFTSRLVKTRAAEQTRLRIFWAWAAGGAWQVADNPRLEFASQRRLYKLYLLHELSRGGDSPERDACAALLPVLLPELQRTLFARP
jgi:hypothetical protein